MRDFKNSEKIFLIYDLFIQDLNILLSQHDFQCLSHFQVVIRRFVKTAVVVMCCSVYKLDLVMRPLAKTLGIVGNKAI